MVEEPDGYVFIMQYLLNGTIYLVKMTKAGQLVGTNNFFELTPLKIYPNPCEDYIKIDIPANYMGSVLTIYDLQGRLVHQKNALEEGSNQIGLNFLPPSVYTIQIVHPNQKMLIERLVIAR